MVINFVITHPRDESPGSFYRPYELVKGLTNLGITSQLLTPFSHDVDRITEIPIKKIQGPNQLLNLGGSGYTTLRKIIYNRRIRSLIPYDKLITSLADKLYQNLEKSIDDKTCLLQAEQEVAALACIKLGTKKRIPVVVDVHNIWPEELVTAGHINRQSNTFRNLMNIEKSIVTNADHIIVVNEFMKDYIITNFKIQDSKITIIPPGGEILFTNNSKSHSIEKSTRKIVYSGLVNEREHVDLLVKSIPYVNTQHQDVEFIISEKGESIEKIKKLSKSYSLKPTFYWYESRDEARKLLEQCYLGALPSQNDTGRKLGTPLKLLEYMSHGLPVVANDIGSWCNIIREEKIGILTEDNPKDYANGINSLLNDEDLYFSMRQNIENSLRTKFSWKNHIDNLLLPIYKNLLS